MTTPERFEPKPIIMAVYVAALVGAFLIAGALAWFLIYRTRPATLNQARIEERSKALQDVNTAAAQALDSFGWQDASKRLVRLSITSAMDLVVREWKDPATGRSNLLARVERANPPPPPPEPQQPSIFE
ncbi:MAG: hypothetical protein AB9869_16825 [Verrucomicrobiia bacterium]